MTDLIAWLDDVAPESATAVAGAKMGRLTELHHAGVQVPPGFTVTVQAYRQHVVDSGLDEMIERVLADAADRVPAAAAEIREAFAATPVGGDLQEQLLDAYGELCLRCAEVNVPTAVRSSATGEDAADASFAGIFDTYLGVSGERPLVDAVRACWGSLFTERALEYRLRRGIDHRNMPIAVGVIELVHARASGVAFSIHPITGKRDRLVIEGSWGWGEAVVQGLVTPDHIEVGKADGRVLRYDIAEKKVVSAFDYAAGRVVEIEMPKRLVHRAVLDDEQIGAVLDAVRCIEVRYGYPVDVEWVLDRHRRAGDPICIVQARPVTVTVPEKPQPAGWNPVAMATRYAFHGKG